MKPKDKQDKKEQAKEKEINQQHEQLEQKITQLEAEKQSLTEQLQRVSADYINYQKRTPKQIADSVAYEKKVIIKSLLPSLDNFAHALSSAETAEMNEQGRSIVKGVKLVFEHMLDALKTHGVEKIEAVGSEFDPSLHEAVMQRAEEDKNDNIVLEQFQAGFTLNGQVIRPAKVIVNKLPAVSQLPDDRINDEESQQSEEPQE